MPEEVSRCWMLNGGLPYTDIRTMKAAKVQEKPIEWPRQPEEQGILQYQYNDSYKDSYKLGGSTNLGSIGAIGVELDVSQRVFDSLDLRRQQLWVGFRLTGLTGRGKDPLHTASACQPEPSTAAQSGQRWDTLGLELWLLAWAVWAVTGQAGSAGQLTVRISTRELAERLHST